MIRSFLKPVFSSVITLLMTLLMTLATPPVSGQDLPYASYMEHPWVDSVLATLTPQERVAQSIWVITDEGMDLPHYIWIDQLVRTQGIGGIVMGQGSRRYSFSPASRSQLIRYLGSVSRVPMAVVLEGGGEWPGGTGLGEFPGTVALGAIGDESMIRQAGEALAREYNLLGAQIVMVPAAEVPLHHALQERLREDRILLLEQGSPAPEDTELYRKLTDGAGLDGVTVIYAGGDRDMADAKIRSLLEEADQDTATVNRMARRVLAFKYWAGLCSASSGVNPQAPGLAGNVENRTLVRELYANALTVLNNEQELIPLQGLDKLKVACIAVNRGTVRIPQRGAGTGIQNRTLTSFQAMVANYTRVEPFYWNPGIKNSDSILSQLADYDLVIAGIYPGTLPGQSFSQGAGIDDFMASITRELPVISVFFGEPDQLEGMESLRSSKELILAYERNSFTEELAAQLIFGGIGGKGKLPLAIGDRYPAGSGIVTQGNLRLQYATPESAGVSSRMLNHKIDSVIRSGLEAGAFPGCEVIAARKGKVIFHKTYGYQTYDMRIEVRKEDLYDLASVTKVSAPLSGLMVLEGMGKFSYNDLLGDYAPAMKGSDKADLWLKDILAHQAGLYPWIPYWQQTVKKNGDFKRRLVRNYPSEKYSMVIADHLYLNNRFKKKIYRTIKKSPLAEKEYVYSGLAFFLFPGVIADLSGENYEDFLYDHIYHRLGAWDLVYQPFRFYPLSRIVPTEYDSLFRKQQIHGYVHDESSATMDGLSGNAGLFATANDLLKLVEMYRRMGSYGGEQIIPEDVLKEYTSYQFPENQNRRGLGFDKPLLDDRDGTPGDYPCPGASPSSFGHSGFTGTFVWADPEYEISYVFLSNRVYPTRNNNLISDMNIRTEVLQAIYDSIQDEE